MVRRLLLFLCLALPLAGCGGVDERQQQICTAALQTIVGADASVGSVETLPSTAHSVVLRFRAADAPARPQVLACRFAGGWGDGEDRDALNAVSFNGEPLDPLRLALLRHVLGTPTPSATEAGAGDAGTGGAAAGAQAEPTDSARAFAFLTQQLLNGIALGALLGLVALGYALVYGITGTVQFAYGELFMIGAYIMVIGIFALNPIGGFAMLLLSIAAATIVTGGYGFVAERIVYRPLRLEGRQAPLVAAIGLSIALREYVRLVQGAQNLWLPAQLPDRLDLFEAGGFQVSIAGVQMLILLLATVFAALLGWGLASSRPGRNYRACADDVGMAALVGVDVARTVGVTFAVGAGLAAVAGAMVALLYGEADYTMGFLFGFKALGAALLGGFGSLPGALAGGMLLGVFEALWSAYFGLDYKDVAILGLLMLILLLRPNGLFGRPAADAT
ncbi:MAG TPA: branched-chain amino acid ABC transporter permease [Stellaceae bacterium]